MASEIGGEPRENRILEASEESEEWGVLTGHWICQYEALNKKYAHQLIEKPEYIDPENGGQRKGESESKQLLRIVNRR